MKLLRNLPIKQKLTIISMVTSSVALLITCGVIVIFETIDFRRTMVEEILTTARIVGDNSAAALTFQDAAAAEETLKSLDADSHVGTAFIYDAAGRHFASYHAAGGTRIPPPPVEREVHRFHDDSLGIFKNRPDDDYLEVFHDIHVAGERVGTVYLRHDMLELRDELVRSGYLAFAAMVGASLVALLLTRRLMPVVSGPIMDLGQVVRDVATRKDFSIRAEKQGDDEVGSLIEGFNEMLGEIQQRDAALLAVHESLEQRVEERTQELASSISILNATLESTADGILALNQEGKVVSYNSKFAAMWGFPADMLQQKDEVRMLAYATTLVVDPEGFASKTGLRAVLRGNHAFDVIELKDGRTFERYVQAQYIGDTPVGRVINYRDITLRKRAEAELADSARQLLETSRQAGMAEVATSVLHNVGNVLNSVNISCAMVSDRIRRSRVHNVAKTAALLEKHSADLTAFLTEDAHGRKLPEYLAKLAAGLEEEQEEVLKELKLLGKNIDHIKEIVSMQQGFARVSGVTETLAATDLVEDSIRMIDASLARHAVAVVRDYDEVPPITVEKHKALQILVNLIRNAQQACDNSGRADKRIIVRVSGFAGRIHIAVTDNGVGIPRENLTKVFAHGFTTKREGHGFGLHSGALAAREMGGTLTVHSEGPGTGATFTLELPVLSPTSARHQP
ncbi:MAG: HAMP domain-containing protein [Verrucomicrobiaceae bacterium]|nr:MAG: HAMP domain-containing protein [Verrucomicrobiaceae bacterium]